MLREFQDEKLATLNVHGDKLLQQNHVESQRIADELSEINERRKKVRRRLASEGHLNGGSGVRCKM